MASKINGGRIGGHHDGHPGINPTDGESRPNIPEKPELHPHDGEIPRKHEIGHPGHPHKP
jgi:hypothetical protein